jgi:hypothetical protein
MPSETLRRQAKVRILSCQCFGRHWNLTVSVQVASFPKTLPYGAKSPSVFTKQLERLTGCLARFIYVSLVGALRLARCARWEFVEGWQCYYLIPQDHIRLGRPPQGMD